MSKATPRVPGEDPAVGKDDQVTTADVLEGAAAARIEGAPMSIEERFAAMEAEQQRLREENEDLKRSQIHLLDIARANPRAVGVEPPPDLPKAAAYTGKNQGKQDDLKSAVLTQEGWVVPKHLGSSPVLHQLSQLGLSATA